VTALVTPIALTAAMVAQATGGRLVGGASSRTFAGVSTDSRVPQPGKLFVALQGDRFDGHAFLDQALANGATGLVVTKIPATPTSVPIVVVADTLVALQQLAREVRRLSGTIVIAVTGSAGKTTTKEVTADLLSIGHRVYRSHGNLNNHIGVPLSLLELVDRPELAVIELGMNHAGEIRTLVALAEPEVRVWTNVGDAHIGHFQSRAAVAEAKAEILEHAQPETLVIANADDKLVMSHAAGFKGRLRTFGEAPSAGVRASDIVDRGFDGTAATVTTPAGELQVRVPLPGRAHLSNVLAAIAVALEFGIPTTAIPGVIQSLMPVRRRGASVVLASGARLIDDSYNASPAAVRAALQALAATPTAGRRVAVLGEMLELGASNDALHRECGRAAAHAGVDLLVAVGGGAARALAEGASSAGLSADRVHVFEDSAAAADRVASLLLPGDLVLVKGSRGTRTDVIVDRLAEVA